MPITSIILQPGHATIPKVHAAYRPILFVVAATATNGARSAPVVFCDIYFNGLFYKTLSATQHYYLDYTNTQWQFDISAAAQEYLTFDLPTLGITSINSAPKTVISAFCRFRSSGNDANGFLAPEGIAPKQGTGSKAPVAGSGTESLSFHILNAVLQHEDNQTLATHLDAFKINGTWEANTFPLSHRPNGYKVCKGDSDVFPFIHVGNKQLAKITVTRFHYSGTTTTANFSIPQTCSSVVSGVSAVVQSDNDVAVVFESSGSASQWEWTITGGTTWTAVNTKTFDITWEDLLSILITEAGEIIITEDGEIIIPEGIDPYDEYTLQIRPRCANGVYGTTGSTTYTIAEAVICPVPTAFSFSSLNYTTQTITFALTMPGGQNDIQLEWKFNYGNGFISNVAVQNLNDVVNPFVWNAPVMAATGTYMVRIRTKCAADDYSGWTSWVNVAWNKPLSVVNIFIASILESAGMWRVGCGMTGGVSADDILVQGYFQGDSAAGGVSGFNFFCTITAGATSGIAVVPGAAAGGHAFNAKILNADPDPTSDGKDLKW